MDDLEFEDLESTPVFSFDEVRPLTPPSSPEMECKKKPTSAKARGQAQRNTTAIIRSKENTTAIIRSKEKSTNNNRPVTISVGDESDVQDSIEKRKSSLTSERDQGTSRPRTEKSKQKRKAKKQHQTIPEAAATKKEEVSWPGDLKAIFDIDGSMSDVKLDKMGLSWSSVAVSIKSYKKRSRRRGEGSTDGTDLLHLQYEDIIGVRIKRERKGKQTEGEGICLGIVVQTFDRKADGRFKDRPRFFGNPSQDVCLEWSRRIDAVLQDFSGRPKNVRVFLQPYAGKKFGRSIYKKEILPLFEMAGITDELTEVSHNEHIKHEMIHMDIEKYDCIICVGGDGTVNKVINNLLNKAQKDADLELKPHLSPVKLKTPVGIIPVGTLNQICHTVQGAEDPVSAAIHIILGNSVPCDGCSVYHKDSHHSWSINSHYGFFASVVPFMTRYTILGDKRIEAAFMKALTKSKFRSYECDILYLPDTENTDNHPNNEVTCRKGCATCQPKEAIIQSRPVLDKVESLDPLNESGNSSIIMDMSKDTPWKTLKGEFCSISVLATPATSELAPQGMSKYAHTNDGFVDLIVVNNTDKKEFLRYLRRHGNDKNQLDLPIVKAFRCKEVKLHARSPQTWNHKDFGFNEILDEVKKGEQRQQGLHRADSIEVIDDLDDLEDSDTDSDEPRGARVISQSALARNKGQGQSKANKPRVTSGPPKVARAFCDDDNQPMGYVNHNYEEEEVAAGSSGADTQSVSSAKGSAGKQQGSAKVKRSMQEKLAEDTNMVLEVSDSYRPTPIEQERARRMKYQRKKAEKKKTKAQARCKSYWNIDNEIVRDLDLHFCVHQGLIRLCGEGLSPQYHPDEVKMGCLGIF